MSMKVKVWEPFEEDCVVLWKSMAEHNNKTHCAKTRFYNEEEKLCFLCST